MNLTVDYDLTVMRSSAELQKMVVILLMVLLSTHRNFSVSIYPKLNTKKTVISCNSYKPQKRWAVFFFVMSPSNQPTNDVKSVLYRLYQLPPNSPTQPCRAGDPMSRIASLGPGCSKIHSFRDVNWFAGAAGAKRGKKDALDAGCVGSGFRSSGVHRFNSNNKIPEDVEVFLGELEAHLKI